MIKDSTGRIYTHYKYWEDWKNGLYKKQDESRQKIDLSIKVLRSPTICKKAMERVVIEWPISTAVNLSIPGCQRPWMGRAACCIQFGVSENITRIAWWQLSLNQQAKANEIADTIIDAWRNSHMKTQQDLFNG